MERAWAQAASALACRATASSPADAVLATTGAAGAPIGSGAAVAFAGIISFVGLVIPHLMRMILGPAHLPLVTGSALAGALLMTLADLAARTAVPMVEMPIGMLTALVGGPFFFWLLRRTRKRSGGWG